MGRWRISGSNCPLLFMVMRAQVMGNWKRRGPQEPGLRYRTPLWWRISGLWEWP